MVAKQNNTRIRSRKRVGGGTQSLVLGKNRSIDRIQVGKNLFFINHQQVLEYVSEMSVESSDWKCQSLDSHITLREIIDKIKYINSYSTSVIRKISLPKYVRVYPIINELIKISQLHWPCQRALIKVQFARREVMGLIFILLYVYIMV